MTNLIKVKTHTNRYAYINPNHITIIDPVFDPMDNEVACKVYMSGSGETVHADMIADDLVKTLSLTKKVEKIENKVG